MTSWEILAVASLLLAGCVPGPPPDPMVACGDYGALPQSKCHEERERDARFVREENARRQARAEQEQRDFERTQAEIEAHKVADAAAAKEVADAETQALKDAAAQEAEIAARDALEQARADVEHAEEAARLAAIKKRCGAAYAQPPRLGKSFAAWKRCWPAAADIYLAGQQPFEGRPADVYRIAGTRHMIVVHGDVVAAWR